MSVTWQALGYREIQAVKQGRERDREKGDDVLNKMGQVHVL